MVEVEIRGKKFPLCLTVAAIDTVNAKCGGLKNLQSFLNGQTADGTTNTGASAYNIAWMLGLLIVEGEENRLCNARFAGETTERRAVPDSQALVHLLTAREAIAYKAPVLNAIVESIRQEISAVPQKNGEHAELE